MQKIVLFTGAGMSVPMDLPAANGFQSTIQKCDSSLMSLLKGHLKNNSNDIEKILFVLEEFIGGNSFYNFFLNHHRSHGIYVQFINVISNYQNLAINFQQIVKSDIFQLLQNFNKVKALNIYINLLTTFKEFKGEYSLSIFTTNYDLIFEDIFDEYPEHFRDQGINDVYYGFSTKRGKPKFDKTEDFKWSADIIEYNKLHGSLDWIKDKGIVMKSGGVSMPASPDAMPILYPGYKGTPTDEPFITIHNKLYKRLSECHEAHVVGFAFRDPYINSIFEFALRGNPKLNVNCYNPCPIKELPTESSIPQFVKNFPSQFLYHEHGIEDKENPLDLELF